jgi:hypothetical protein
MYMETSQGNKLISACHNFPRRSLATCARLRLDCLFAKFTLEDGREATNCLILRNNKCPWTLLQNQPTCLCLHTHTSITENLNGE